MQYQRDEKIFVVVSGLVALLLLVHVHILCSYFCSVVFCMCLFIYFVYLCFIVVVVVVVCVCVCV